MYKLVELEKKDYEKFTKNNKYKSHFLQSYSWGEFCKIKKDLTPYYVGLKKDGKIVATALLLKKQLPFNFCYFYSPRGFVLNYEDEEIFCEMTKQIIEFTKKKHSIFIKIDPDIIWKKLDYNNEEVPLKYDSKKIYNMIKKCGFKHLGFTKNFETKQPRYTFRIDLTKSMDEIESRFSKTTKQRINKSKKLGSEVVIGNESDLDKFCELMKKTEDRKDFVSYDDEYYKILYKKFNEDNKMTLFLGKIYPKKIITNLNERKENIEKELSNLPKENLSKSANSKLKEGKRQLESIEKDLIKYKETSEKYGDEIVLNAHMIIEYGNKAWVLYAGNDNILTETYANYQTYVTHLKYCKEQGYEIYDQFGTIGDLRKDNPRFGLHEFKKKFGGDYIEFIGEFDYITNKFMYLLFTKLVPFYRNLKKKKSKKELSREIENK